MNRFLLALALLVVVVLGLGFYLGWFQFSVDSPDEKTNITIDRGKIREDAEKAKEKVQEAGEKLKERIGAGAEHRKGEDAGP